MKISVFITSYNQREYLVEAIESVLNQTLKPFEIMIVDDCSSDGSQELIHGYASKYPDWIRPICHPQNLGIAKNKAFAQREAKGDWLTYLDGDDRYLPEKLEQECKALQADPEAKLAFCNFYLINPEGERYKIWADGETPPTGHVFPQVLSRDFPRRNLFRNELVNYEALKSVGFYDESRTTHEDWDLKIRLTKRFKTVYCPEPLTEYRRHEQSISKYLPRTFKLLQIQDVYRNNEPLLRDLSPEERRYVEEKFTNYFKEKVNRTIRYSLKNGDRPEAFRCFQKTLGWTPLNDTFRNFVNIVMNRTGAPITKKKKNKNKAESQASMSSPSTESEV